MPPLEAPFHPVSLRDAFLVPFLAYWPPRFTKPLESSPINYLSFSLELTPCEYSFSYERPHPPNSALFVLLHQS